MSIFTWRIRVAFQSTELESGESKDCDYCDSFDRTGWSLWTTS